MSIDENFEATPAALPHEQLILDLGGYEGPLDVLLELARVQKVDLVRISILNLAEQYLAFIQHTNNLHLEITTDYLIITT